MSPSLRRRLWPVREALPCPLSRPPKDTTETSGGGLRPRHLPLAVVACARLRRVAPPLRCSAPPATARGQQPARSWRCAPCARSLLAAPTRPRWPPRSRARPAPLRCAPGRSSRCRRARRRKQWRPAAAYRPGRLRAAAAGVPAFALALGAPRPPSRTRGRAVLAAVKALRSAALRSGRCAAAAPALTAAVRGTRRRARRRQTGLALTPGLRLPAPRAHVNASLSRPPEQGRG